MVKKTETRASAAFPSSEFDAPASLGYAMPAEWQPHEATWIAWPHNHEDWPDKFEPIPWIYAEIVRLLAQSERVHIFVQPSKGNRFAKEVQSILDRNDVNLAHVTLHTQPTDRVWTRDSGPIFLKKNSRLKTQDSALSLADFKFNAWAKYDNNALDDALPSAVADYLDLPRFTAYGENNENELQRFVLEGGSIDVNGNGCVLTTEECLLSDIQQRNPNFSRDKIEQTLHNYLGTKKVLWLNQGIAGDDTHGHIDDTARFVNPATIVACIEPNKSDPNHAPMKENWKRLKKMRDTQGKQFTLAELPLPGSGGGVFFENQRLPASYANFYIANTGVLVPVFNDPNDTRALKILEQLITDRPIIPVYCRDLVWGLGTLHCMTQQQPA
ncbi:MAG TPA: agmatine deiminase family protein [Phycisphaerae bacterium]|nr:agmatine deiminase family protein [Phycisphaerae bacterium]